MAPIQKLLLRSHQLPQLARKHWLEEIILIIEVLNVGVVRALEHFDLVAGARRANQFGRV